MKRPSTVSQNVRAFVTAAALAVGAMGCASGNDTTGGAGAGGAGSGGGGSSGTACALADVNKLFLTTSTNTGCTVTGACHDAQGSAAGLDLISAGWEQKLVGKGPSATAGAATLMSKCAGLNLVYLKAGTSPATGLFLDKLSPATVSAPPCGVHMPNLGAPFTATQFACVQSWANTLTK
jgi:hypothetical protein